jgi:protein TonB
MGFQAFLFCPDEKLSAIVSRAFEDLDFLVESIHDPLEAAERLNSLHYDAIVVDCENESNASLLFRSAKNSSLNKASQVIALVEGQAGIAKAYRLGASLVLTKPINVEQVSKTLRVLRGLLRKNSEAAESAAATEAAATPITLDNAPAVYASTVSLSDRRRAPRVAVTATRSEILDPGASPAPPAETRPAQFATTVSTPLSTPFQSTTAWTKTEDKPVPATTSSAIRNAAGTTVVGSTSVAAGNSAFVAQSSTGFGAATAPAKIVNAPPIATTAVKPALPAVPSDAAPSPGAPPRKTASSAALHSLESVDTASRAASQKMSSGGSGLNKILIAGVIVLAVAVLAVAALGYFGYGGFDQSKLKTSLSTFTPPQSIAPAPVATPANRAPEAQSAPVSSPAPEVVAATPSAQASPLAGNAPVLRIAANPPARISIHAVNSRPEASRPAPSPFTVKPETAAPQPPQTEEAAPQLPAALAAPAKPGDLSGVISSSSSRPNLSATTLKLSQGVSAGLLIKSVPPKYPPAALTLHTQGKVLIEATITREGIVTQPRVLKGDPMLARAAIEAVRQWRYKPYFLDGQPIDVQTQITVDFKTN